MEEETHLFEVEISVSSIGSDWKKGKKYINSSLPSVYYTALEFQPQQSDDENPMVPIREEIAEFRRDDQESKVGTGVQRTYISAIRIVINFIEFYNM
jgi:hypothetical protein